MQYSSDVPPLSNGVKLAFGVGQIAEGLKTCVFATFLLFYYNQVLGLAGNLAGLAILIALLFDAFTDPIAGSISDRWQGKGGRRHPFMFASAVPLGVSFILLFTPLIDTTSQGALFGWMLVMTIATRASMTLYHVPHMAVGAELSEDYDERTVLVAIRHFFGAVGFILAYVFGFGIYFAPSELYANGQLNPDAYPGYAVTLGVMMTLTILMTSFGTRSRVPYMPKAQTHAERIKVTDILKETVDAMRNTSFRWMMFGFILIIAAWGMASVVSLYVYTFFWELSSQQILLVVLLGPIGSMFGYMFSRVYFKWLDKKNAMIVAALFWMVVHSLPVGLYMAGLAPPPGSWAVTLMLCLIGVGVGIGVGQIVVGIGTAMADIADENELRTGRRQEGVFFGASAFANKCSAGLGSFFAGLILSWIDWPTGEVVKSAADVPPETLFQLAFIAGPVIALLAIPGALCLSGYRLNRTRLEEIQAELRAAQS